MLSCNFNVFVFNKHSATDSRFMSKSRLISLTVFCDKLCSHQKPNLPWRLRGYDYCSFNFTMWINLTFCDTCTCISHSKSSDNENLITFYIALPDLMIYDINLIHIFDVVVSDIFAKMLSIVDNKSCIFWEMTFRLPVYSVELVIKYMSRPA